MVTDVTLSLVAGISGVADQIARAFVKSRGPLQLPAFSAQLTEAAWLQAPLQTNGNGNNYPKISTLFQTRKVYSLIQEDSAVLKERELPRELRE